MTRRALLEAATLAVMTGLVVMSGAGAARGLFVGLLAGALALASTGLHELAHAWVGYRRRLTISRVVVTGALHGYVERRRSPRWQDEMAVPLAGPLASLGLLLGGVLLRETGTAATVGTVLMAVNVLTLVASCPPFAGNDVGRAWAAWRERSAAKSSAAADEARG